MTVDRRDVKEAVTRIKQRVRRNLWMRDDFFGEYLDHSYLLIAWLPRHAADLITKYKTGHDGKTADQKRTGTKWKMPLLQFGKRAHFRLLQERFVGFHSRSGCLVMMTEKGVLRSQGFYRMTFTDRWDPSDLPKLHGLPWNLAEDSTRTQQKMINGRSDESWEVVQNEDDQEERYGIVRKKNSEHLRGAGSYANGAIYAVSVLSLIHI